LDLLKQLRDVPLGHNLPSENIKKGVRASIIADEDVLANIKHNIDHASGAFGGSRFKGGSAGAAASSAGQPSGMQRKLKIQSCVEEDKEEEERMLATIGINLTAVGAVSHSADFADDVETPPVKKVKIEPASASNSDNAAAGIDKPGEKKEEEDEDEDDDVQWADDDNNDDDGNDDTQWNDDD
jgi:ribosomal protein L12E/L44/L45/RPP1/RPP2